MRRDPYKIDLNGFPANRIHVLQNRTKINPKILEMVSEYEYDVMMFMMLCTSTYIHKQSKQVLRFRLAWSLVGKYPLEV